LQKSSVQKFNMRWRFGGPKRSLWPNVVQRAGLLPAPQRTGGDHRWYQAAGIDRLLFHPLAVDMIGLTGGIWPG